MKQLMPDMKMDPESMKPGVPPAKMIDAMLKGWQEKYGSMPDVSFHFHGRRSDLQGPDPRDKTYSSFGG